MSVNPRFKKIIFFGALLGVFAAASGLGGMAYFHFGDPQHTCASCHEMGGVHAAWAGSAHSSLHCRNCHGGSLTLDAHALSQHANRVVQHFKGVEDKPIHLAERDALTVNKACRACHPQSFKDWESGPHATTYAKIFLDEKHNKMENLAPECLRCHGMFFDGHIEDLVSTLDIKGPWALKDASKAAQPAIPCLACHQVHTKAGAAQAAELYVRREKTHFAAGMLPVANITQGGRPVKESSDPRQRLCVQCHAPNANRECGSQDDRTPAGVHEGLSCLDCHQTHTGSAKNSCGTCHPQSSHCGLDVEKMDTTFRDEKSKHNVHFVGCGDCHNGQRPVKTVKR